MTLKIVPQVVLKTFKEFRNVLMKDGINNQNTMRTAHSTDYNNKQSKSESNKANTKKTLGLLPITLAILPVIFAAQCELEKPPLMKYTDLPIYDAPHYEYNESQANTHKCKQTKQKIVYSALEPYVTRYRCCITEVFEEWFDWFDCVIRTAITVFKFRKDKFLCYMRDDKNLEMRKAVVALGSVAGFALGSTNFYLTRNLFFGVLAGLFTGWLCFPTETDALLRKVSYYVGKQIVCCWNFMFGDQCKIQFEKRTPLLPQLEECYEPNVFMENEECTGVCKRRQSQVQTEKDKK